MSSTEASNLDDDKSGLNPKNSTILCPECSKEHYRYYKRCPNAPLPRELCHQCSKIHGIFKYCPNVPCTICYKDDHYFLRCPFLFYFPQGEDFDKAKYEIVCQCGFPFDTNKWLCKFCPHSEVPKLQIKRCEICQTSGEHITVECPKDTELAAMHKSKLDKILAGRNFRPYHETIAERAAAAAADGFSGDPSAFRMDLDMDLDL